MLLLHYVELLLCIQVDSTYRRWTLDPAVQMQCTSWHSTAVLAAERKKTPAQDAPMDIPCRLTQSISPGKGWCNGLNKQWSVSMPLRCAWLSQRCSGSAVRQLQFLTPL